VRLGDLYGTLMACLASEVLTSTDMVALRRSRRAIDVGSNNSSVQMKNYIEASPGSLGLMTRYWRPRLTHLAVKAVTIVGRGMTSLVYSIVDRTIHASRWTITHHQHLIQMT